MQNSNMNNSSSFLSEFAAGFVLPFKGVSFLFRSRGLKRFAILPLLFNIVLYAVALAVLFWFIGNWEIKPVEWDFWWSFGGWLGAAVNWLRGGLKLLAGIVAVMVAFFTFTGVGLVLASPLNDLLSEKVEAVWCGKTKKLDLPWRFAARATFLSVCDSLRNLFKQLLCSLVCLPLLLIPVIGFIPLFLVGSYFSGFGFLDSAMARNFLRPRHKRLLSRKKFWRIIGLGASMQALFFIPLVGLLLLPVGVTAGTLLYCDNDWRRLFAEAGMTMPQGFVPPERDAEPLAVG